MRRRRGTALKDLRNTFASHLLSAGVQLAYVSAQLGHADVAVTAKHYAAWCGGDEYRAGRPAGE
jgi:integrase